jgi:4-diphosphocytidyl-2-C-methyl-D-erythritol kinase
MALALVLVNPRAASSTAEAYGRLTPAMYSDGGRARTLAATLGSRRAERVAQCLYNGLEGAVIPAHPEVGRIKAALSAAGALGALMSGSGPTVFGIARSVDHARQVQRRVRRGSWECWAVRTLGGPAVRMRGGRAR